ncbi:MAG: DUF2723 domain-containing protein [candidate division WOR-3 bacterium]|uniref:DUF2723 domain-containing protein n=2 Tax=candidate division WOR-3 bacterium TaxID=2052148 RepID=A0A7C1NKK0_UNCW3|nr:DUF2723 domain-containing protein [candidate division WOR-3 bacterium]
MTFPLTSAATRINFLVLKIGLPVRRYLLPLSAFLLPFALYFATTARDIFWLDSAEFAVVTAVNGLAHPPGYPLLLWVLKAAGLVPFLSLPFRLNLVSSLFAAGSCLVLFLLLDRLTRNPVASLLGALVWAVSWELWQQATAIEVYSLHTVLVALLLLVATIHAETGSMRSLLLIFFLLGLGIAHHLFIIFWIPSLMVIALTGPKRPLLRSLPAGIALLLLGPLLYFSLLFRSQDPPGWAGVNSLSDLLGYVTARIYRYRFLAGGTGYLATQFRDLPKILFQQFTIFWLLLIPGVIGMLKSHRRLCWGFFTGVLTAGPAVLLYNIPDKEGYFLPVWLICALFIGSGIHYLSRIKRTPVTIAIAILTVLQTVYFYPRQDRSHLTSLSDLTQAVNAELPENAVLFTDDYSLFQAINWLNIHSRPEDRLTVISQYHLTLPWYLRQLGRNLPVPEAALATAESLWNTPVRTSDIRFGELARRRTEEIMATIISSLRGKRAFFFPQNFTTLLENWQGWQCKFNGMTYELVSPTDTLPAPPESLHLPGPERYQTSRFYDPLTVDLCRRFAATVNRRGMLKYARGDASGAIADFNRSLQYYPEYPSAIENKGLVFAFEGKPDSARHYLRRFLELEPDSPEREKVKLILSRLGSY